MKHRHPVVLASAMLLVASAGCTAAVESAQEQPVRPTADRAESPVARSGDDIRQLTHGIEWARMDPAPVVQGF